MYKQLRIYDDARALVRLVAALPSKGHFGDLHKQLQRASLSVASNIAEGAAAGSDRLFAKYLNTARGSLNETLMQCQFLSDLGHIDAGHPIFDLIDKIGRSSTQLYKRLLL